MSISVKDSEIIYIDTGKSTPIYRQIIESVQQAIAKGLLKEDDPIPSVNATAAQFSIARGSVFKAYNELRSAGIIDSIPGKGYFIINTRQKNKKNIFLLMSTYNPYREVFYNAFIKRLKNQASVDLYFHHHNIRVFETLIQNHAAHYNTFIIMPEIHRHTRKILKQLNQRDLYILETGLKEFGSLYPGVCQNYAKDIYQFFESVILRLNQYKRVVLLFSDNMRNYNVIQGFNDFFKKHLFEAKVIRNTTEFQPVARDLCLVMDDNDLVRLIMAAKSKNWKLGRDIGIISYHETPLKSIISDGITTISPDFYQMGISMADMILQKESVQLENPFLMTDRHSF